MEAVRKTPSAKGRNILLSIIVVGVFVVSLKPWAHKPSYKPSEENLRLKAACDKVLQVRGITSVSRGYLNAVSSCMADPIGATR